MRGTAYVWYYIHMEIRAQKKEVSDFLVIGYLYSENTCNFIYVTSFCLFSWLLVL